MNRAKARVAHKAAAGVAVVAAKLLRRAVLLLLLMPGVASAAILPADRADVMYHGYDGGGLEVSGPSVLVRKGFKDKVSVWANYYVDMITSASIDVVATASPYEEQRDEISGGIDYLRGKTLMGISYTNSEENDYKANTARIGISQDFFGDLTTLGISYARGWDTVLRNGDAAFEEETDRQTYRVDLSQIITKSVVLNFGYEGVTDDGFLHNPYRSARYADPSSSKGYSYEAEVSPGTKTSTAMAIRGMYYLPYRASARAEYRYYTDTWGVDAWNVEVGYVQPLPYGLTAELTYRYYTQGAADFYSDLFPRQNSQNFLSRDKELASFVSNTLGVGLTYEFGTSLVPFFKRGEFTLFADFLRIDYDDFRDVLAGGTAGVEPLYQLDSTILRAYLSVWY